jgi:hypothetical protein
MKVKTNDAFYVIFTAKANPKIKQEFKLIIKLCDNSDMIVKNS